MTPKEIIRDVLAKGTLSLAQEAALFKLFEWTPIDAVDQSEADRLINLLLDGKVTREFGPPQDSHRVLSA